MKIREIKKEARVALSNKWGLAVGFSVLLFVFTWIVPSILDVVLSGGWSNYASADTSLLTDIISLIISIIVYPITIGYNWAFLGLIRREPTDVKQMFTPFLEIGTFLRIIGTSIIVGIFTTLWTLLLIVPGIIKALAYSQTFFVLKDNPGMTILGCITESRRLMHGYKWKYFLLQLSFIGWLILGVIALGIGLLWVIPYIAASSAEFYNELRQQKAGEETAEL